MTLAETNANPGDLRLAGQLGAVPGAGGFASFQGNTGAGAAALANQIQTSINKNPDENLVQFAGNYAPKTDNNNPGQYAASLANKLGVSPGTTIGSLQSRMGDFTQAIANTEDSSTPPPKKAGSLSPLGAGAIGVGAGLVGAGAVAAAPEEGLAGLAAGAEDLLGGAGDAIKSGLSDIPGLSNLFGGAAAAAPQQASAAPSTPSPEQTALTTAENSPIPPADPTQKIQDSPTYSTLSNMLSSMVGGQQVQQEAQNRGVDPIAEMIQTGNVPQPDENGNLDKATPINGLQGLVQQDKAAQGMMVEQLTSPTNLDDMEKYALDEVDEKMRNSPALSDTKKRITKLFDDYRSQIPEQKDADGKVAPKSVNPKNLQEMKDRVSEGDNWALPFHERKASQHVYSSMKKRLSDIAKHEHVKGWDETNKRMEARLAAIKAIKKMPKKAERDKKKELMHDLLGAAGGALIGKTLGNGLVGSTAGYLLARRLDKKHYKSIGSQKELHAAAEKKQSSLLSREIPNFPALPPGSKKGSEHNPHIMKSDSKDKVSLVPAKKVHPTANPKTGRMQKTYSSS